KERRAESPSESTGQLLWLVFAVLVAGTPHLLHLHPWVPVIVLTIISWRILAATRRWHLPSIWLRVPLTLIGFLAVLISYRQVSGLSAGSALLLVMVSMKLLETRGHRDRAVVVFICYFLLFAAFLREQAIWSAGYLLAGVLVTTAALYQTARVGTVVPAPRAMAMAFRLVIQAVPLMLLLFFLFPRIPGPFWALPSGSGKAVTGLTNEMTPGDITELAQSDKVAFRVRFDGPVPEPNELYWRGPVMTSFNGRTWRMTEFGASADFSRRVPEDGRRIDYELTVEPHGQRWLLALEVPVSWNIPQAHLTRAFQLVMAAPIDRRVSYRGSSALTSIMPDTQSAYLGTFLTNVPQDSNPRALELARARRAEAGDEREYLDGLLDMFRRQEFFYSLTPPKLGEDAVDEFLFDTRRGFCGHFASAFTVLARAAGIPARVVTGYQGAEFNPLGSYWIVRQSDAHAWAEVWIDDRWIRYDPTAAVAPWRIERGFASGAQTGAGAVGALRSSSFINRLAMSWDAINAGWNRWVLSFGPDAQTTMMSLAGIDKPATEYLVVAMAVSVTLALIVVGLAQRRHHRPQRDGLQIAYERLCARLGTAARTRDPQEGPREYANAVAGLRPDLAAEATPLFDAYIALRYDRSAATDEVAEFAAAVRRFRPRAASPAPARA
ncbi:MAG: transglutaminase TgpA family protein, partial [Gammaproteobacteria bacterium]